ncbi:MAG: patatin-like phospholipase family protein [Raoultibacter sp.]
METFTARKTIDDVALIFEGGGMRASYTAAAANILLENGIDFTHVYGVSAGSSNSINYVSRDIERTRRSFTDFADDPQFGGIDTFLKHKGIFNAHYIYQEAGKPDGRFPFDMTAFLDNPAQVTIEGFDRDTGETLYWTKEHLSTLDELMLRVRASSSLPLAMVPTKVGVRWCYDGGLGEGAGIMLARAMADGFERFFVVCTRPYGYRKEEKRSALMDALFWRRPHVREALSTRPERYNKELDRLEQLESEGRACVFYSEKQAVENAEKDSGKLHENYRNGYEQAQREFEKWASFLGI